ncbi:MAG: FAD:protein FMN transferase [Bacilli bacterium]|nr:FAD:protein FMN transferase [Bacilli bacterium]
MTGIFLLGGLLFSCSANKVTLDNLYPDVFSSYCEARVWNGTNNDDKTISSLLHDIHNATDRYNKSKDEYANVYDLNNSSGEVEISSYLFDLLNRSEELRVSTAGLFNHLGGNLSDAWKAFVQSKGEMPTDSEIEYYLSEMNSSSISLRESDGHFFAQKNGTASIDLGGIAKGYAVSKIREYFKSASVTSYYVNCGLSSIILGGKNGDGEFSVGFNDLKNGFVSIKNTTIGTSGVSEQKRVVDGVTYSHIVNMIDGSASNDKIFASVFCDDAVYADAAATFLMSVPFKMAKQYASVTDAAIVIYDGKEVYAKDITVLYH